MEIGLIRQVKVLFLKEVTTEWRNRYAINGILVQLIASVFIASLCFQGIKPMTWNALLWIILMFSSVNAIARSFIQEHQGRLLYYHSLVDPVAVLLSKLAFNIVLGLVIAFIGFVVFCVLLGTPEWDLGRYSLLVALFSIGISQIFTTVSAIASKTKAGGILMPLLSFPIIIPLMLVGVGGGALLVLGETVNFLRTVSVMVLINVMIAALSTMIFQFLWQD